jgi:hypothetical protein
MVPCERMLGDTSVLIRTLQPHLQIGLLIAGSRGNGPAGGTSFASGLPAVRSVFS